MLDPLSMSHLMVTGSYIIIPLQFSRSLSRSPHCGNMPWRLVFCLILMALFFFLCGMAHFLLALGKANTAIFTWVQMGNAIVSATTAVYLIPLIPDMFALVDTAVSNLQNESKDSKSKLFTFMAFLCHEIRNPLFAITSSAECLQDTTLTEEQMEEVCSIGDSSLLMLRLVNDVLDLSKLDSGKLQLEYQEFDLHSLLKRLGENMARQVLRKHQGAVQMKFELGSTVPRYVVGDSVRIIQIIYNLLSNSCKFTSQGTISLKVDAQKMCPSVWEPEDDAADGCTVTMSHHRPIAMFANEIELPKETAKLIGDEDDEDEEEAPGFSMTLLSSSHQHPRKQGDELKRIVLSITVSDTGIGIPPERLKDIFEPYTQAKLSDFRQHGGTGLGLSIIASLTKTMGGTISVTSRPGEGAKFHLKLPVQLPDETVDVASRKSSSLPFRNNKNMDYVGELLPTNQGQVPQNFLECQRMPDLGLAPPDELNDIAAKAYAVSSADETTPSDSDFSKDNGDIEMQSQNQTPTPAPLFQINTNAPPPPFKPSMNLMELLAVPSCPSEHTQIANNKESSAVSSPPGGTLNTNRPNASSFNLPPNDNVVLVVDDNSINRKILGKMLKSFGLEHTMACNGQEAVNAILSSRNNPPNAINTSLPRYGLVFMDISMPVMDGNTAIQTIRRANITVPIVALSANVLSEERDRTIRLGADEFHTKPILRNNLKLLCQRYLLSKDTAANSAKQSIPPTESVMKSLVPRSMDSCKGSEMRSMDSCKGSEMSNSTATTETDDSEVDDPALRV